MSYQPINITFFRASIINSRSFPKYETTLFNTIRPSLFLGEYTRKYGYFCRYCLKPFSHPTYKIIVGRLSKYPTKNVCGARNEIDKLPQSDLFVSVIFLRQYKIDLAVCSINSIIVGRNALQLIFEANSTEICTKLFIYSLGIINYYQILEVMPITLTWCRFSNISTVLISWGTSVRVCRTCQTKPPKVCVKTMSMYRKYLLKRHFWAQPRKQGGEPQCYVKHDVNTGGVYAYIQHRGVRIVTEGDQRNFSNFNELDEYLDKLSVSTRDDTSQFLSILNRRTTTKMLRQLPL
ncbi:MAG: hypothetical protein ACTSWW_05125 [Promethearchaeota archaeon]